MAEAETSDCEWDPKRVIEVWQRIQQTHIFRRGKVIEFEQPWFIRQRHRVEVKQELNEIPKSMSPEIAVQFRLLAVSYVLDAKTFVSKTPLNKLERTAIPKLILEESAKGTYILARSLESWLVRNLSFNTVIEDHEDHVIGLSLCNFPTEEMFFPGDVIIIKEPYLRLPNDNIPVIYSDCPTNIIILRSFHPLHHLGKGVEWKNNVKRTDPLSESPIPSNACEWKERGKNYFIRGAMIVARDAFHFGINACLKKMNSTSKTIQLYLFAAQLRLEYFEWVVEHAGIFLKKFPEEKAAYLRLGNAYYGLRKYEEATKTYENYCKKFPGEKDGLKQLERAKERVRESKGEFDFDKLRKMSIENPSGEMDCADYSGLVEIVKISGKGRGLVATRDLKKGEVVMVSKALAALLDEGQTLGSDFEGVVNRLDIVTKLSRMIAKNPNTFGPLVYDLQTIEKRREAAQLFCDPDLKNEPISDVEFIENIFKCNSFTISEIAGGNITRKGCGLFLYPSYLNHSCTPNLEFKEFFNDVMVIRAAKNIKEGTELTISYVPLDKSFEERTQLLNDRGIKCRCLNCKRRM